MPYHGDVIPIAEYAGTRYQPSNGTEGAGFWEEWCCKCARDKSMNGEKDMDDCGPEDLCDHLAMSFQDEGTPAWVFGEDGWPKCTEFVAQGDPTARDDKTIDMFEQQTEGN